MRMKWPTKSRYHGLTTSGRAVQSTIFVRLLTNSVDEKLGCAARRKCLILGRRIWYGGFRHAESEDVVGTVQRVLTAAAIMWGQYSDRMTRVPPSTRTVEGNIDSGYLRT